MVHTMPFIVKNKWKLITISFKTDEIPGQQFNLIFSCG